MGTLGVAASIADAHLLADLIQPCDCPLPVIARVQGAAMGGIGLVAACDLAVAAEARAAFSEARLGIVPAVIHPSCCPR
jgi:enoyl-CoA hydratase/carnithine racemase